MSWLPSTLLGVAGLISILFGIKYSLAREFMPYHATVTGRSWSEVEPGMQAIIMGMYRIMGGGFITYGVALLWLLLPLRDRQAWAAAAALTISLTALVPIVDVTLWLRKVQPAARTPVAAAALVLALAVVGSLAALFP